MPQEISDDLVDGHTFNVTTIAGTGDFITVIFEKLPDFNFRSGLSANVNTTSDYRRQEIPWQ